MTTKQLVPPEGYIIYCYRQSTHYGHKHIIAVFSDELIVLASGSLYDGGGNNEYHVGTMYPEQDFLILKRTPPPPPIRDIPMYLTAAEAYTVIQGRGTT